ncbi:MAG: sterol desaturase family protein [Chryseolinea sp.]
MKILAYIGIVIGTFLSWEFVAWFTHRFVMHGFLWSWHRSHHTVHQHKLERNDLFALVFSVPSIALFYYATLVRYSPYLICVAIGIFCYGLFYFIFHDVIVHQRVRLRLGRKSRYLQRMINAHYTHHGRHTRDGCEAFGFLIVPRKYTPKNFRMRQSRQETQ